MATNDYAAIADVLRRIADGFDALAGQGLPEVYLSVAIQPGGNLDDEVKIPAIDAVALELLGKPGAPQEMSGGTWHHHASGYCGPVRVGIYNSVAGPAEREMRAELARLRAALDERKGAS